MDPFGSESGSDNENENEVSAPSSPAQSPNRVIRQTPLVERSDKDYSSHYERAQARRLARHNGTVYDPSAHAVSHKERMVQHATAVAEVPELIGQISLKTEFHRRPPAIDRLRTDTELDDLAASIISEMDSRIYSTEPQPQSEQNVEAPLQIQVDTSYVSSPVGTAQTIRSGVFFADELTTEENHQVTLRLDTEDIDVDDEIEHSAAFSALLRKVTSGPPGARINPTFTPTQSSTDPLTRKLAELREKYARATHESTVSHTISDDEGSENGDTNDESYLEEVDADMFQSQYGFEDSVKEEEVSELLVDASVSVSASVSTAQSDKSALRKDFLKNFKKSKFYRPPADNGAAAKAKLKEITDSNYELVLRMMAAAVQKLVDPAKALRTASKRGPASVSFPLVQDALAMHASYRSFVSSSLIIDMFKEGCKLSSHLIHCSEDDLLALCQACSLQELRPKEKEKDSAIETLHLRGEAVLSVYIVMQGQLEVTTYETEDVGFDEPMEEIVEKHHLVAGDCVGECVLEGTESWEIDVAALHAQPISLCSIPLEAAQRYVGRHTEESERIICLFWKFHRLWQEIKLHNQEMLLHAKYQKDLAGGPKKRENLHFDFSPMNVISSCRIRVYQPGTDVFTHNRPRHHLYLVLRGCCEYRRTFPENIVAAGLMPPYKEIGKPLMCGDFSFMDGEDHLWLDRLDDQDELVAGTQKDSAHIREHKLRKYCRFDRHKNSLVATTRVEIAVVPLREIAKCLKLFVKLIRLATEKYPDTFMASEELVRQHYEGEKWKVDRKDVIRSIAADKEARVLRESYYYSVQNNVSDELYKANQPGAKMQQSTLHSIIQHFSDRASGGPTDIPPEQLAKQNASRKETWSASRKVATGISSHSNNSNNSSNKSSVQAERRGSAYSNESNKILDDMNRPRREALEDYFKQFGTSRSRKNSRKFSTTSEWDTTESAGTSESRRNSTKSQRSNSVVSSFPTGGEKSFKARPPLWISRPSSAAGSSRHSVSGTDSPGGEMGSPASRSTFSPRPSQKSASPARSANVSASPSASTTPAVSSRHSSPGRRPSSAGAATASSFARMSVPARPFSSQSTRTRQISPPQKEFPPVKLVATPPKSASPAHPVGKARPPGGVRPSSAVHLSVSNVVLSPSINHHEHTERPHSTGSSRLLHKSNNELTESVEPPLATPIDGEGVSVRIKKKNVGFANFAAEFAVDDALAAERNAFVAVDNSIESVSQKNSNAMQCTPPVTSSSPVRTLPFQTASQSPSLLPPSQVNTPIQSPSPATGSPHTYSHRYWRIKDETRKQSNRPVPIDPEKFVEVTFDFLCSLIYFLTSFN